MRRYAEKTGVPAAQSKAEIERILERCGADKFMSGWDRATSQAVLSFEFQDSQIRYILPMPDREADEFHQTPGGRKRRDGVAAHKAWEQACRQRWRALALIIKAKLEAVKAGITTFEKEFMGDSVAPNGRTLAETILPQLEAARRNGRMPALLPDLREGDGQ